MLQLTTQTQREAEALPLSNLNVRRREDFIRDVVGHRFEATAFRLGSGGRVSSLQIPQLIQRHYRIALCELHLKVLDQLRQRHEVALLTM